MSAALRSLLTCTLVLAIPGLEAIAAPIEKCIQAGKMTSIEVSANGSAMSSNNRKWTAVLNGRTLRILNNDDGTVSDISLPGDYFTWAVGNDGTVAFLTEELAAVTSGEALGKFLEKHPIPYYDPKSKKIKSEKKVVVVGNTVYRYAAIEGSNIIIKSRDGKHTYRYPHGLDQDETESRVWISNPGYPERPRLTKREADRKLIVYNTDGTKRGEIPVPHELPIDDLRGELKAGSSLLVGSQASSNGQGYVNFTVDLNTLQVQIHQLPSGYMFSTDDWHGRGPGNDDEVLLSQPYNPNGTPAKMMNLKTGALRDLPGTEDMIDITRDERQICGKTNGSLVCVDYSGRVLMRLFIAKEQIDVNPIGPNRYWIKRHSSDGTTRTLFESDFRCVELPPNPLGAPSEASCSPEAPPAPAGISGLGRVLGRSLCERPFKAADWDAFLGQADDERSIAEGVLWLQRFSKPGGFEPSKHLRTLLLLLEAQAYQKHPKETAAALAGILTQSDVLFDQLLKHYPMLRDVMNQVPETGCQTEGEKKVIRQAAFDHLKRTLANSATPSIADFAVLAGFARAWLDVPQREALADASADKLTVTAAEAEDLEDLFASKINKFAWEQMKELYGLPHRKLTDTAMVLSKSAVKFVQLSHQAFEGSQPSAGGFHYKLVREIPTEQISTSGQKESFEWTHDGKRYRSDFQLQRGSLDRPIVTTAPGPDYSSMWKGGEFRGLVIAGTNLGATESERTLEHYLKYFAEHDFRISEPVSIADVPKFLNDRISGDKPAHYLIKEAHSDGDEKNLFRVPIKGRLIRGEHRLRNGKREVIEIVYSEKDTKSALLPNRQFGAWIRAREKKAGPELIYLNASCWSKSKATFEIGAAASPLLINIPTVSTTRIFRNHEKSGMYQLVDSVRKNADFKQMREALKKNPEYAAGKENVFIFPDEDQYQSSITSVARNPIDAEGTVLESDGRGGWQPYTIEDEEH